MSSALSSGLGVPGEVYENLKRPLSYSVNKALFLVLALNLAPEITCSVSVLPNMSYITL